VLLKFREPLLDTAFTPLTRVDTRRAFVMDAIDEREVLRSYLSQGYSERDAEILLDFNRIEKERSKLGETGEARKAVATALANAFESGIITSDDLTWGLGDLGYQNPFLATAVARSTLERQLKRMAAYLGAVRRRFLKGKIDLEGAGDLLEQKGFPAETILEHLDLWCAEVGCEDGESESDKQRDVTKTEIVQMEESGLLQPGEAKERLVGLGYLPGDADLILANAAIRRGRAAVQRGVDRVRNAYVAGTIDPDYALAELDGLGIPQQARDTLLAQWKEQRELQELTRVRGLLVAGNITADQASIELELLGIPPPDVNRMVGRWAAERDLVLGVYG
jgi:hypothetical protein